MDYEVNIRIAELSKALELGQKGFAETIDTPQQTMSNIFNNKRKASLEVVIKILKKFSNVSATWLLTGQTSMFISADEYNNTLDYIDGLEVKIEKMENEIDMLKDYVQTQKDLISVLKSK